MPTAHTPHALYQGLIADRLPEWLATASADHLSRLHTLCAQAQTSRTALEEATAALPRFEEYASAALSRLLAEHGEGEVQPATTVLHWVSPEAEGPVLTCTLVQAALRDFSEEDACPDAFGTGSGLYRDSVGASVPDPGKRLGLSPWEFARACRAADVGGGYARLLADRLPAHLLPETDDAAPPLPRRFAEADRDALRAEACVARMRGSINATGEALLANWGLVAAEVVALPASAMHLKLAGFELVRVLVIMADQAAEHGRVCLLYIPNDPKAPLTQHASPDEMAAHLQQRLGDPAYLRFMAGFVGVEHEQGFIQAVQGPPADDFDRLYHTAMNPLQALELALRVVERETPFPRPAVSISYQRVEELFSERYAAWARQTLADAQVLAVSTRRIDRAAVQARHHRWIALGEQLGLLVLSFIPGVGQAIGVYSMVQLLHTVFDASRALGRGDERLARELLLGAAENSGTLLASPERPGVAEAEAFAERLQLIAHPNGESRFWLPDTHLLGSPQVPQGAMPAGRDGIVRAGERAWVRLGDRYVAVADDVTPWEARMLCPEGYRGVVPRLLSNGRGGWRGEFEQPATWDVATLVRRSGTEAHGLADAQVAQAVRMADTPLEELRGRATRGEPLPGLLRVMLERRAAAHAIEQAISALRRGKGLPAAHPAIVRALTSLPGWPQDLGIELVQPDGAALALPATAPRFLRLTAQTLTRGDWLAAVIGELTTAELGPIIGQWNSLEAARRGLARAWAQTLEIGRGAIIDNWGGAARVPAAEALARQFPSLAPQMIEEIVGACDSRQLQQLEAGRVPLAAAELAVGQQRDLRISLACEALAEGAATPDRDALLMGLLPELADWPSDAAIELDTQGINGRALYRAGAHDTPAVRIQRTEAGRYAVGDGASGAIGTLEEAVAAVLITANPSLPAEAWAVRPLRERLMDSALERRGSLRALLGMTADTRPLFRSPSRLADGRLGYRLSGRGVPLAPMDVIGQLLLQLYPQVDTGTFQALRREIGEGTAALDELARRHTALNELRLQLGRWLNAADSAAVGSPINLTARELAVGALVHSWQRQYPAGRALFSDGAARFSLSLRHLHLGVGLPALTISLPHILEVDLTDMNLERIAPDFLASFPNARVLALSRNPLRELPVGPAWLNTLREVHLRDLGVHVADNVLAWLEPARPTLQSLDLSFNPAIPNAMLLDRIARFTWLRELELDDNAIELTPATQNAFVSLANLASLSLDRNPLGLAPGVQGLSRLQWLSIADAGLQALPGGLEQLLSASALRLTYINLAGNRIHELPDLSDSEFFGRARVGDSQSRMLHFNLDANPLDDAAVLQMDEAGLDFEPLEEEDVADRWLEGCPEPLQARIREARTLPGAESFYQVLSEVVRTAPYIRATTAAHREEVAGRAWALAQRFLPTEAQPEPGITALRDRLYDMATEARGTCGDGVVLTLDQFEAEVAVWEAISGSAQGASAGAMREAATVARRQFRQALLDGQAQRLVRAREARRAGVQPTDPADDLVDDLPDERLDMGTDEVELRLVLRQRLRQPLDLPPVSERLYEALVGDATVAAVASRVRELDTPEAFAQWLVNHQHTWRAALERLHAEQFEQAREPYDEALAHVLALAAGEAVTQPLPSTALAALEAIEPEIEWRLADGSLGHPALNEQQAYLLSNGLNQRCMRALDALRLRLTHALLGG